MLFFTYSALFKKAMWAVSVLSLSYSSPRKVTASENFRKTPVEQYGPLSVRGNKITDTRGRPVQLRGMSLFWSQWMGGFYNSPTVKWLKDDWHCTVVRAAMGVESGGYLQNKEREKAKVVAVVEAAIKEGLYVIIDWHDHRAEKHLEESKAFFSEMAKRYGQYPNVIYEIYNEPLNVSWQDVIKPYSEAVIKAIREHDQDNLIICGTRNWSQQVEEAADDPIKGINIAYSLHFYAATHKADLRAVAANALKKGIALMVTEFGTTEASGNGVVDEEETAKWLKFLDDHKISWCNWSVATKNESSAALKRGADTLGGWTNEQITASGQLIKKRLQEHIIAARP